MTTALLSIGFRPFYLGAALFASLAIPAWYAAYAGWLPLEGPLPGLAWHSHEMLFGFAPAVIGGFLLTSVRAWTGRPTLEGVGLALLVSLWFLGRVLLVTGPAEVAIPFDLSFLPLLALALSIPLVRTGNWRNTFVIPILLGLGLLSAAHHGAYRGWMNPVWAPRSQIVAVDLIAVLLAVIGGRVIPAFSANAVDGLQPRRWVGVEVLALGLLIGLILLDLTGGAETFLPARAVRVVLGVAGLALHSLTVGAMAGLMLAMMTRSSLGHTGRTLRAGAPETLMFVSIHAAALARVAGPLTWPVHGARVDRHLCGAVDIVIRGICSGLRSNFNQAALWGLTSLVGELRFIPSRARLIRLYHWSEMGLSSTRDWLVLGRRVWC